MDLMRKFLNQTRKPEGFLGRLMLRGMNPGHAALADWGLTRLPPITPFRIAELGCGGGRNAGELLNRYPQAHVTAIDYSALSVEKAKAYNKARIAAGRCAVLQRNVADLRLPEGAFDLATAFETVYFWPGLEACFAQVAGILKPGGLFLICNESDGKDEAGTKYEDVISGMKCYTAERLEAALKTAGFSETTSAHHDTKPWITILAKK